MTAGGGRGLTDPINLPLLFVLTKIGSLGANQRQPGCDLSTVMTSASNGVIWSPDGAIIARDRPIVGGKGSSAEWFCPARPRADPVIETSLLTAPEPS
jgi:hypothetical protein